MAERIAILKREVARIAREIHTAGWVSNHDGNATVRLGDGHLLATPTAVSKRLIATESVLTLDATGKKLEGAGRPFSELNLHLTAYRCRPDVKAVLHAHPPTATGLGIAGVRIEPTVIAEAVVSIGDEIPLVPYARPGEDAAARVAEYLTDYNALVLANHGVLTVGDDLEMAYCRMELVEHLARINVAARQAGPLRTIPDDDVRQLLEKRAKAGLDPRRSPKKAAGQAPSGDLEKIVEEEIRRVLQK